jgi:hypothetical protein
MAPKTKMAETHLRVLEFIVVELSSAGTDATKDAKGSADLSYKWFFRFRNKLPPRYRDLPERPHVLSACFVDSCVTPATPVLM